MSKVIFSKPFTQQEQIPDAGIDRAVEIMKTDVFTVTIWLRMKTARQAALKWNLPVGRKLITALPAPLVDMQSSSRYVFAA